MRAESEHLRQIIEDVVDRELRGSVHYAPLIAVRVAATVLRRMEDENVELREIRGLYHGG